MRHVTPNSLFCRDLVPSFVRSTIVEFFLGEDNGALWCSWRMRRREDMVEVRGEKGKSGEGWGRGLGAGEAQEQFLNLL